MDILRNICTSGRASLAKIRNLVIRIPLSSLFLATLILVCLTAPNFYIEPDVIRVPARLSKPHSVGKAKLINTTKTQNRDRSLDKYNHKDVEKKHWTESKTKDVEKTHLAEPKNKESDKSHLKEPKYKDDKPHLKEAVNEEIGDPHLKESKNKGTVKAHAQKHKRKEKHVPKEVQKKILPNVSIIEAKYNATVIPFIEESSDKSEGLTFKEFKRYRKQARNESLDSTVSQYLTGRGKRKYAQLGRYDMLLADRNCKQTLPEAIIIGVMKAGTEAFSTFLAINPQIAMSLNVRSTLFFTSQYSKGLSWYRQQMACKTKNQTTIEKAPQYFPYAHAPPRIHKMNKDIKLILLVRNPIDRAMSHYLQVNNSHPGRIQGRSFEDIIFTNRGAVNPNSNFIYLSKYSLILKRWLKYFKLSQILILDGDEFKEHQIDVLAKAESFLGVQHFITEDKFLFDKEKGFYCLNVNGAPACLGSGKGREHPILRNHIYHKLRVYFKPYNEELFRITGQRFDW